nr:acetyl-CoA carboxylase beta subunit [Astragalus mongholicus]
MKNGSKRNNNNDHYIYDIKSNWNNNFNSCIESYLRSQICIDSYILGNSVKYNDFNSSFFGKVSDSGESKSTSIITSTNDSNASYLESSNNFEETENYNFEETENYNSEETENYNSEETENSNSASANMRKFQHLWVRCESCYELHYKKILKSKMNICENCGFHLKTENYNSEETENYNSEETENYNFEETENYNSEETENYNFEETENYNSEETENSNSASANMRKFQHLWVRCESCYELHYKKILKSKMNICENCGFHLKMSSSDRIELLIDPDTWNPMDEYMVSVDPIEFHSEEEPYSLDSYQKRTGLMEAIQTGTGQLNGIPLAIGIMEFQFIGGSMGSVVGEKITRLIEYATNQRLPLILVCASGGARMQEGSLSLMQMAKISSALYDYQINQKLFYVTILTSPTTGGVTASFGMLGDIIIAEPDAYIAFAGKRVIEETLKKEVPEGSQSAELLFEKGLLDSIVPRNLLKEVLTELFQLHGFVPLTQNEK